MKPIVLLAACAALCAQIPEKDARNQDLPHTDTHFQMPVYRTLAEWETRKAYLRKQILSAAGLLPMPEKTPLNARMYGRIENQDYSIEKVLLETLPGYYLGGNLYRPLGRAGKHPGIASPHGHWSYGRLENSQHASVPARCINLARQGHVVLAYDMVGYNDTVQTPHAFGGPRESLWSFGPLGLQLWNSIRVVDFLQSLPDVDPERIGATGASGGGTQTFLLYAVDDRVKAAAPVNMISAIMQGGSPCENAPNLRVGASNLEIGAMMAPRPLLMVAATGDWTRNTPREEFPAVQSIYKLYGKPENVETVQFDAPHNYNRDSREAVYRFFARRLLGVADTAHFGERNARIEKLQDMLALHNYRLPDNAVGFNQLLERWIENARRQNQQAGDPAILRERLSFSLMAESPGEVLSHIDGERVTLSRAGRGDRVPGIFIRGNGPAAVVVDPEGAEAARRSPEVQQMLQAGRSVLLLEVFHTGGAEARRSESRRHFLTFNKSVDAERVQDILTGLAFLKSAGAGDSVRIVGRGKAAIWALFAAAISPGPVSLHANLEGFAGTDREFIDSFFVPGIQRAGGLAAALRLVKRD